jgi:5-methylcytosine-specific restriction endonuclease McrA
VRRRDGGSDDESNLIALCSSCHSRRHAVQGESFGHGDEKRNFARIG